METLKIGSKGDNVKKLQEALGLNADGNFGKKTEEAVKKFQKEHGLTDNGIVGPKTWDKIVEKHSDGVDSSVIYNPINVNIVKAPNREIKYLVIHYTAGASSKAGSAKSERGVFLNRTASADFVVDDEDTIQINPDPKNYFCYAVGDGKGKYGITNKNSISIEICSNLKSGTTAKVANHEGWYFTEASIDNAVKLAKILMDKFNIPIERVVRHYDASRKLCPGIIGWNTGTVYDSKTGKSTAEKNKEDKWNEFKNRLS